MRRSAYAVAAALILFHGPPLHAQDVSVLVGGLHARYADSLSGTATSLGGRLAWESRRLQAGTEVGIAEFTTGSWAAQLAGNALMLAPVGGRWYGGVLGGTTGAWLEGGSWSGVAAAGPLVVRAWGPWLASAAGRAGGLRNVAGVSHPFLDGALRVRRDADHWGVETAVTTAAAGSSHFTDVTVGADLRLYAFSGSVVAGARSGSLSSGPWAQVDGHWRFAPSLALEVSVGNYPRDVTGFEHGFFLTAGLRLGLTRGALTPRVRPLFGHSDALAVERMGGDRVRLVFRVPRARSAAIAGTWNGWERAPLTARGDGRWEIVVPLAPGAYRFSLVLDGRRWFVPAGVPEMPDDFGGRVGVLVIPS